ncbi:MAG: beta-ketoacyl synthase N-terminal-like domain-containing protein [Zavarzinella sp.]
MQHHEPIAIVGMAGRFAGARNLNEYWQNILQAKDCSSEPPSGRWVLDPARAHHPELAYPDRVYSTRGYYMPPLTTMELSSHINGVPVEELDPVFHLAWYLTQKALNQVSMQGVNRDRCGIVFGNIALPTAKAAQFTANFVSNRAAISSLRSRDVLSWNCEPACNPIAFAAADLGFGLGGYAIDAACASSLYAIKLACDELQSGQADLMIAGGQNQADSLYNQMGFSQLRALSRTGKCSPFDARGDGLLVGDGGAAFVLKRLSDAEKNGNTIIGVIRGIGLSNDIEGNLLSPASEGQLRAMRQAYEVSELDPESIQMFECHATGTPTGDATEFHSLQRLLGPSANDVVIGSVKSSVGHLLTGAGAASLAKALLAINHQQYPPTANFLQRAEHLSNQRSNLRVLTKPQPWVSETPRLVGVNAFGFGGINAHLIVEEYRQAPAVNYVAPLISTDEPIVVTGTASVRYSQKDEIAFPLGIFRIPPTELAEMLPQQTILLQALHMTVGTRDLSGPRTGIFVGAKLDINTTNFHVRWALEQLENERFRDIHPPLTANRTMGVSQRGIQSHCTTSACGWAILYNLCRK